MAYLLDTSAFSLFMRDHMRFVDRIRDLQKSQELAICAITRGEIMHGLQRLPDGRRRNELALRAQHCLANFPCFDITSMVADTYAEIKARSLMKGRSLSDNDLWIASAAMTHRAILVTVDADFDFIDDLRIENWLE